MVMVMVMVIVMWCLFVYYRPCISREMQIIIHICCTIQNTSSIFYSLLSPPSSVSGPSIVGQYSLSNFWQNGIALFWYCFVRLKLTINYSLFLASRVRSTFGFLGSNLEVFSSWVHLVLKSKHMVRRQSDRRLRPETSKAKLYEVYSSSRITLRQTA